MALRWRAPIKANLWWEHKNSPIEKPAEISFHENSCTVHIGFWGYDRYLCLIDTSRRNKMIKQTHDMALATDGG